MSLLDKMRKRTTERRVRANHPILSLDIDRDVRDAYLQGLVFASVADDEKIDDCEREYLSKVGLSLELADDEINEVIHGFASLDSNGKLTLAETIADALKGSGVTDIFLCEFSQVWTSHNHDDADLDAIRRQFSEWMDVRYDDKFFAIFDDVSAKVKADPSSVYVLYDYLDDDVIRYLFADIFEIEKIFAEKREVEERAVVPHPLKTVLDDAQRVCYLNAIRYSVNETSDKSPTKIQQKGLRHLALALGVKDTVDLEDEKSLVLSLDSGMRTVGFFFYCDMARLFAMDGSPAFSAVQNQKLEGATTSFKMASEDVAFLKRYSAYLGNGKEPDVAEVVRDAQSSIRFPDGFIGYFTPNMKPIILASGDAPVGVYQIVDGHYRLEKPLVVGSQTKLIIKNAVIDFAPEAEIKLYGSNAAISESEFNGEKTENEELMARPFFNLTGDCTVLRCGFNGANCRTAFGPYSDDIQVDSCQFNELRGSENNPIVKSNKLVCRKSQWANCIASNNFFDTFQAELIACDFVNCTMGTFVKTWLDSYLKIIACLFEECLCNGRFKDYNEFDDDRSATLENNYQLNCQGVDSSFSAALEQLREARAKVSDDDEMKSPNFKGAN